MYNFFVMEIAIAVIVFISTIYFFLKKHITKEAHKTNLSNAFDRSNKFLAWIKDHQVRSFIDHLSKKSFKFLIYMAFILVGVALLVAYLKTGKYLMLGLVAGFFFIMLFHMAVEWNRRHRQVFLEMYIRFPQCLIFLTLLFLPAIQFYWEGAKEAYPPGTDLITFLRIVDLQSLIVGQLIWIAACIVILYFAFWVVFASIYSIIVFAVYLLIRSLRLAHRYSHNMLDIIMGFLGVLAAGMILLQRLMQ